MTDDQRRNIRCISIHRRSSSHNIIIHFHLVADVTAQVVDRSASHCNDQVAVIGNPGKKVNQCILIRHQLFVLINNLFKSISRLLKFFINHQARCLLCMEIADHTQFLILMFGQNLGKTFYRTVLNNDLLNIADMIFSAAAVFFFL